MKKIILVFSLIFISLIILAQNQNENVKKNEIGLTLISIKNNFGQSYSEKLYFSFINGVDYKRYFENYAIRVGIDYRNRNDKGGGDFVGTSSYQETRLRIGCQRLFGNTIIKPFIANDIILINSKFKDDFSGGYWAYYSKEDLKYFGYGFAPTVGLNINLTNLLSLYVEFNFEFLWINKKGTQITNSLNGIMQIIPIKSTEFVKRLNPLNILSFNYKF